MTPEDPIDAVRHVWQHQDSQKAQMSLEQIRVQALRTERTIHFGRAVEQPELGVVIALAGAVVAVVFVGIGWMNAQAGRAVQRCIEELDEM